MWSSRTHDDERRRFVSERTKEKVVQYRLWPRGLCLLQGCGKQMTRNIQRVFDSVSALFVEDFEITYRIVRGASIFLQCFESIDRKL